MSIMLGWLTNSWKDKSIKFQNWFTHTVSLFSRRKATRKKVVFNENLRLQPKS